MEKILVRDENGKQDVQRSQNLKYGQLDNELYLRMEKLEVSGDIIHDNLIKIKALEIAKNLGKVLKPQWSDQKFKSRHELN